MLHALVCTMALVLSTGCAGSLFAQGERMPGTVTYSESAAVSQGMAPLIRTTRGTGLVVGVRVPFDLGRSTSADDASNGTDSPLMSALLGSNLGSFVAMQRRASQPKNIGELHAKLAMRGSL